MRREAMNHTFSRRFQEIDPLLHLLPYSDEVPYTHYIPVTNGSGKRFTNPEYSPWPVVSFPAAGNSSLAWEFTQHLLYAVVNPVGESRIHPAFTYITAGFGDANLKTPIIRDWFVPHTTAVFEDAMRLLDQARILGQIPSIGILDIPTSEEQAAALENVINQLAIYNEMPVTPMTIFLPDGVVNLLSDILDYFMLGVIDAQTTAQRMHNVMALWLIE
jgi:hypothetical protein